MCHLLFRVRWGRRKGRSFTRELFLPKFYYSLSTRELIVNSICRGDFFSCGQLLLFFAAILFCEFSNKTPSEKSNHTLHNFFASKDIPPPSCCCPHSYRGGRGRGDVNFHQDWTLTHYHKFFFCSHKNHQHQDPDSRPQKQNSYVQNLLSTDSDLSQTCFRDKQ